ncbi:unnamed protein product [Dracunculus medinensis]|uniref:Formin-like protein n=1 Tax=Dracunculus medinensis TaxID=318479 RepID=A0A0N4U1W1_DRAME|nr:unnamed protein product [Dracunculus medinensis]
MEIEKDEPTTIVLNTKKLSKMEELPPENEIISAFEDVLNKMDLPPDKMRVLRNYDLSKKWDLVCDQRKMYAAPDPSVYLQKLTIYSDKKSLKKKKKLLGDETSTEVLKHIEISLRTNSIDWVRLFLSEANNGLQILVEYLSQLQEAGGWGNFDIGNFANSSNQLAQINSSTAMLNSINGDAAQFSSGNGNDEKFNGGSIFRRPTLNKSKTLKNIGDRDDDIHVCVSCLRAIMNNKYGFNMVFSDPQAIYCIARSILHQSLRTKALVLELLAAICLVKGGHELIIDAFNRFRTEYREVYRFQLLFSFFRYPPEFHVEFMTSCMQFFNILVHSTENMNYRSFLQYEFTLLGLDDYLEILKSNESEQLQTQRIAYLENKIDVTTLVDEAEKKVEIEAENARLSDELSKTKERLQEVEADYIARLAHLDRRLKELNAEKEKLLKERDSTLSTMRRTLNEKDKVNREQQAKLESRIQELEKIQENMKAGLLEVKRSSVVSSSSAKSPPSPPPPPPGPHRIMESNVASKDEPNKTSIPPAPPPPPPVVSISCPPPAPPLTKNVLSPPANDVMTIKKVYNTKNKLPLLNWCPLKPNQAKDTVFSNLDDEKIMDKIDFSALEDKFKIGVVKHVDTQESFSHSVSQHSPSSSGSGSTSARKNTILDTKRLQNIAITCRKLAMPASSIMAAVHRMDLKALPAESVDILQKIAPTQDEMVKFRDYENQYKNFSDLSDEDQFLAELVKIERFDHKLKIMSFMATFDESADLLEPQFVNLTAASKCVREATKFHKILEVMLAYGNYMNSGRKGAVYGFKISSLDTLSGLKSSVERSLSLLHIIAETISKSFPDLLTFPEQLKFADKASGIMWEAVLADMRELEANYTLAKKERELKGNECPPTLINFLEDCEKRINNLQQNCRTAAEAFNACVEFYGESSRNQQPHLFFSRLLEFTKKFQQALQDNEARHALEQRMREDQNRREKIRLRSGRKGDEEMINELEQRLMMVNGDGCPFPKRGQGSKLDSSQIKDGDFEKIMIGLREGAYVAFDGPQNVKRFSTTSGPARIPPPVEPKPVRVVREPPRERS